MLHDPNWDKQKVDLDDVSQHLLRAADYIEKHGWCQHQLRDPKGRVCLFGAMFETDVNIDKLLSMESFHRIGKHLNETPHMWNDKIGRTKDEVVCKLREIAFSPV
jgi:hypothetical protein